jgi:hypothetical protein
MQELVNWELLNYVMWQLDQNIYKHEKARDTEHVKKTFSGFHNM